MKTSLIVNEKNHIIVPKEVRFLSNWEDFKFSSFPEKCIIDKQIPGCGYTEWCISNNDNVILASPRRILLQNKKEQHENEVLLVISELDKDTNADEDISKDSKKTNKSSQKLSIEESKARQKEVLDQLHQEISEYILRRNFQKLPYKILVTYDSYYLVRSILINMNHFDLFHTVVDEFQSILHDARFKSDTELGFMEVLKQVKKVHFVSATPMLEKYIKMLPDFKDLPYFEIDWGSECPKRIQKPELKILSMKSVGEMLPKVIKKYQEQEYDILHVADNQGKIKTIVCDEAVFYVNSVNHIVAAIKKCGLKPEEVNIICSNTPENLKRINQTLNKKKDVLLRGGSDFKIGKVPLKGVKPKKYTFCTRTVYLGADFYSECAQSYVFSDSNLDCLAVDISQDLPQILGRQRLESNPWKNSATFYYRTTADYNQKDVEFFEEELKKKVSATNHLLSVFEKGSDEEKAALIVSYEDLTKSQHYKKQYVSVTNGIPCFNSYAYVSEVRAFDIQQKDYADRFFVFSELTKISSNIENTELNRLLQEYKNISYIYDRLRFVCELNLSGNSDLANSLVSQLSVFDPVKEYYDIAGPEVCRSCGYNTTDIRARLGISIINEGLTPVIYDNFKVGEKYTRTELKKLIQNLYISAGSNAKAKASDIEKWFEVKSIKLLDPTKTKWIHGVELLKRK